MPDDFDIYKAFRLNADKLYSYIMTDDDFRKKITGHNTDRNVILAELAEAGIFANDDPRRGVVADSLIRLRNPDQNNSSAWDKLDKLATALGALNGPPWG